MALGKNLWRPFPCDAWEWLQDHEPLAQRLLLWMWTGPDSTAMGLVRLREYSAAGALKSKPAAIRKALDELAQAGRVVVGASAAGRHDVWLDCYLTSQAGIHSDHRQLIKREIEAFANGLPKTQALVNWAHWDAAYDKAGKRLNVALPQAGHTEKNRTEQNSIPAVAKATAMLAAPVTPLALTLEPQADEEPAIDWLKVQEEAQDPQTSRRDFRVKPNVTPEAALRIAQADAKRAGILPPEPQQLAMDLPAGKPKRELTPAQLDAIFAKKRLQKVVNEWNEVMAGINAPCDYKAVEKLAGTLMGNLAKYEHRDVFDDASCLFGWAMAVDRYHAGKDLKKWSLQAWLTAEHLALVFATYRANKGEGKLLTLDLDRTIRHWRLAVETAELNNKIAAQREAA